VDIDANTVALAAVILGGAELRLAVSRLTARLEAVERQSLAKRLRAAAPILVVWLIAAGALAAGAEPAAVEVITTREVLTSGASGAAAGAPFGPAGVAVGAAVGVLVALTAGRWIGRRKR
jgi:hypothetical protein